MQKCAFKTFILSNLISNFRSGFRKILSNSRPDPKNGVAYKKMCIKENTSSTTNSKTVCKKQQVQPVFLYEFQNDS